MNALVVYFSQFGNTRMLAESMAEAMAATIEPPGAVRVAGTGQLGAGDLAGADLVVMGVPTHRMNLPEVVRPVLDAWPRQVLKGKAVAAFDTSYRMNGLLSRFTAARRLDRQLRQLGGRRVMAPETFIVAGREGPLEAGEVERARQWAQSILACVAA
jgi:flavodoxin